MVRGRRSRKGRRTEKETSEDILHVSEKFPSGTLKVVPQLSRLTQNTFIECTKVKETTPVTRYVRKTRAHRNKKTKKEVRDNNFQDTKVYEIGLSYNGGVSSTNKPGLLHLDPKGKAEVGTRQTLSGAGPRTKGEGDQRSFPSRSGQTRGDSDGSGRLPLDDQHFSGGRYEVPLRTAEVYRILIDVPNCPLSL